MGFCVGNGYKVAISTAATFTESDMHLGKSLLSLLETYIEGNAIMQFCLAVFGNIAVGSNIQCVYFVVKHFFY